MHQNKMAKFGVLRIEKIWGCREPKSYSKEPYLVITTNVINREILEMIDTENHVDGVKNLIFQVPDGKNRDITFDIDLDVYDWSKLFNIEYLEFRGKLVNKQFGTKHLNQMPNLRALSIGATNYPLFEEEDVSNLKMIPYVSFNGYGMVQKSENLDKWTARLEMNDCTVAHYI